MTVDPGYGKEKLRNKRTEGTFNRFVDENSSLRDSIEAGMPIGSDIVNRYINMVRSDEITKGLSWMQQSTFRGSEAPTME